MNQINQEIKTLYLEGELTASEISQHVEEKFGKTISSKAINERVRSMKLRGDIPQDFKKPAGARPGGRKKAPEIPKRTVGITEAELRARFDVKFKLETAAKGLQEGKFLTRQEFVDISGLKSLGGYTSVMERPEFDQYRGKAGGTEYWGHPKSMLRMKEEGILRSV